MDGYNRRGNQEDSYPLFASLEQNASSKSCCKVYNKADKRKAQRKTVDDIYYSLWMKDEYKVAKLAK